MSPDINKLSKIPKPQNSKGFALWNLHIIELLRRDEALFVSIDKVSYSLD